VERVLLEREGPVAWLRMNRPETLNGFDQPMIAAMLARLAELRSDPEVRAAVLTGAGRAFCTGLDTKLLAAGDIDIGYFDGWQDMFDALEELEIPLVAAVNGHCLGGGLALALCADYRIGGDDLVIGFGAIRHGIVPPHLARLVEGLGSLLARRLVLFAEYVDAQEAFRIGLVDAVVPAGRLEETARQTALRVCQFPAPGVREAKRLLRKVSPADIPAGRAGELTAWERCLAALTTEAPAPPRHG
jgi:enoyl-CoA hydratase/carnithine racemase